MTTKNSKSKPKLSRRERERQARRNEILDAAQAIFEKEGYNNATMAQIAEKAEFSVGSLYYFFPNKDGIFAEMVIRNLENSLDKATRVIKKKHSWQDRLEALMQHYLRWGMVNMYDIILAVKDFASPDQDLTDNAIFQRFIHTNREVLNLLSNILQEACNEGCPIDPHVKAVVIIGALNNILDCHTMGLLEKEPEEYIPDMCKLVCCEQRDTRLEEKKQQDD